MYKYYSELFYLKRSRTIRLLTELECVISVSPNRNTKKNIYMYKCCTGAVHFQKVQICLGSNIYTVDTNIYIYTHISAVKRLIAINRIQNKSFCLHNICVCTV